MKHGRKSSVLLAALAFALCQLAHAQVLWNGSGQYRLEPHNPPQSFAIGDAFTAGYALDVHGELMTPQLGNVFKTDAPGHMNTYWRMFHIAREYGNLFHLDQTSDFNINATSGYLRFHTNTIDRMRLTPTLLGQAVNGYPGLDLSGHLGIGGIMTVPPLAYLHINRNGSLFAGYRPWMLTGTYMSENTDGMYVGTKNGGPDRIDAVINWSDNKEAAPPFGPDALRFIFTRTPDLSSTASTTDGLEIARLIPATNGNEGYFGIGDFFTPGLQPTERLHILNGRVRIQQLPTDPEATTLDQYMVVDNNGVVNWRHLPTGTGTGCEWTLLGAPGSNSNIATAYNGNPGCPQENRMVGIGTTASTAYVPHTLTDSLSSTTKLHVFTDNFGTAMMARNLNANSGTNFGLFTEVSGASFLNAGIEVLVRGAASYSSGVRAKTFGAITEAYAGAFLSYDSANITTGALGQVHNGVLEAVGLRGRSYANASISHGVRGEVHDGHTQSAGASGWSYSDATKNFGLLGISESHSSTAANQFFGVYGRAINVNTSVQYGYGVYGRADISSRTWAGYFDGNVHVTGLGTIPGGVWGTSDENLKENIIDIPDALGVISQLNPKSYDFLVDEFPQAGLPTGQQYGFLAQELEQVIPEAVKDFTFPATIDSTGQEIDPALPTKIVNTAMLIPFLVAAVKEQQATIAQMQDQLDQCCAANPGMAPGGDGSLKSTPAKENVQEQRLVIQPNPFTDHTTLSYYVPQAGKVSLQVSTSDGKPMGMLREEQAEAGAYTYEWNTSRLASGTYFCTLMVDGAVVVKRAVKVAR